MAFAFSKKAVKVSSYQKLKERVKELESNMEAIIERPHSSQAKAARLNYKLENDLV